MKNKLFTLGLLVVLLLGLYPLFHTGVWKSHDGEGQIVRIALYTKAILDGQLLVRWAGSINYSYGSPLFIFYYPLPYYLGAFFHLLGLSLENTFKLLMGIGFICSCFSFYLWMSQLVKKKHAVLASLLYIFGSYHILDMYVRGDIGEITAFAILPLIFFFIEKALKKNSLKSSIIAGILYGLLIISHNGISLMFSPFLLGYLLIRAYMVRKKLWNVLILFPVGLFLSAFFWLPALYEQKYILSLSVFDSMYQQNFPSFFSLFFSPWGFGPDVNKPGGLSPQIGIVGWVIFFLSLIILIKERKKSNGLLAFGVILFLCGIFLATPSSQFFYKHVSLLRKFQFPWRFLAYNLFGSALLGGLVLERLNNKLFFYSICLGMTLLLPFVIVPGYFYHPNNYYTSSQDFTFYHGEAIPRWTAGNAGSYPKASVEIIGGEGKIQEKIRTAVTHIYTVNAQTNLSIMDNTVYFPGWNVYVDNEKTPIQFQDMNHRGIITFTVPPGKHTLLVEFRETGDRLLSDMVSLVALIVIVFYFVIQLARRKK